MHSLSLLHQTGLNYVWTKTRNYCYLNAEHAVPISATSNWTLKVNCVWTKTRNYCYLKAEHDCVAGSPYPSYIYTGLSKLTMSELRLEITAT
jgi:hypothetical protein